MCLDAVHVPVVRIKRVEQGVQPVIAIGFYDDRRGAKLKADAGFEELGDRANEHGGRLGKAREVVDLYPIAWCEPDAFAGEYVAELVEGLAASEDPNVVRLETYFLRLDGRRAWGFGEESDRSSQLSALCPRRLSLRERGILSVRTLLKGHFLCDTAPLSNLTTIPPFG